MGADKRRVKASVYHVLTGERSVSDVLRHTPYGDLLPSSAALAGAGVELAGMENREFVLKGILEPLATDYDYILIDCPPSLELLTVNGLCAAQSILVPVQCEYFALEGLSDLPQGSAEVQAEHAHIGLGVGGLGAAGDVHVTRTERGKADELVDLLDRGQADRKFVHEKSSGVLYNRRIIRYNGIERGTTEQVI